MKSSIIISVALLALLAPMSLLAIEALGHDPSGGYTFPFDVWTLIHLASGAVAAFALIKLGLPPEMTTYLYALLHHHPHVGTKRATPKSFHPSNFFRHGQVQAPAGCLCLRAC